MSSGVANAASSSVCGCLPRPLGLRFPLLLFLSGTSSVLGTSTEAITGSVTAAILAFTVLSS